MMGKIVIIVAGVLSSMGIGAFMSLWQCSQRRWCPRYLRRQLEAWHRQMERQNAERHHPDKGKISDPGTPSPPEDRAA